jgi:GDP-4-dehydro-6-deoxy-D-mannose reductase
MRVLVTGADGFVGRHVVRALVRRGDAVHAASGPQVVEGHETLDVTDAAAVNRVIEHSHPEAVIHLAGQSSVAVSHVDPVLSFRINALGTVHLLDAVRRKARRARVLIVSSGEIYGRTHGRAAIEADVPAPLSPYASAKLAAEIVALQYARGGLDVQIARPFNHIGPGQHPSFALPSFATQLRAIAAGTQGPRILVGNLETVRDFSHVDDVVSAYLLLLARAEAGAVTNVSSGTGRSIRSLLDELLRVSGLSVSVEVDPARFRPADAPELIGSPDRLKALGWVPQRSVAEAVAAVYGEVSD